MSKTEYECPKCGKELEGEKPWWNEDVLVHLYHDEKLMLSDIGSLFDISESTLLHWMDKRGVERRSISESYRLRPLQMSTSKRGYERFSSGVGGNTARTFPVHRLLAIAEYGLEAVKGKHVHHKNGIPWDNRIENLEIMDPFDHQSLHGKQQAERLRRLGKENAEQRKQTSRDIVSPLSESEVKQIKWLLKTDVYQSKVAEMFNVSAQTISRIKHGESWADVEV